jgi:SagB-type dehydrogenase family enzyme
MTFLSHLHTDLRKALVTRRGATAKDPDSVPRGLHKTYERMEKILLPQPEHLNATLADVLERRTSYERGSAQGALSLQEWGTLLGLSLKKRAGTTKRNYPSGGGLYPIETYLITTIREDLTPAVFHYNPSEHALEKLWPVPADFDIKQLSARPEDLFFSSLVIFTSLWKRSSTKYGDFSYTLALLEAGHMAENVLLAATALRSQARGTAYFDDDLIASLLDFDIENEQVIHCIAISS